MLRHFAVRYRQFGLRRELAQFFLPVRQGLNVIIQNKDLALAGQFPLQSRAQVGVGIFRQNSFNRPARLGRSA